MAPTRSQTRAASFWVDVGALLRGRGAISGIPRLISQLVSVWLTDAELRLRLCRFNASVQAYEEVPPEALCTPAAATAVATGWASRLRGVMPAGLRRVCRDGWGAARSLVRSARRPVPRVPVSSPFQDGDVLFLPGAGWDDTGACETLARIKQGQSLFVVSLICDIVPLKLPQYCDPLLPPLFAAWLRALLPLSDLVLAISQHTRRDLLTLEEELPALLPPIEVIRLGDELKIEHPLRPRALPEGVEDFVLTVGTLEPRKNHWLLYHLWRRLAGELEGQLPPLVLAGRPGWNTGDLLDQLRRDPLAHGRILLLEDIGDRELLWLYRQCRFTLYPSHYEGWGLPVAESLAHGKLCICSDSSSLPEIAPDLCEHHDALDLPAAARLVRRALLEPDFLQRRETRIRLEFRTTPWRDCAARILGLLHSGLGVRCGATPSPLRARA